MSQKSPTTQPSVYEPLASRMRPDALERFIGQAHLLGEGRPLRKAIESGSLHSMIFWGPPGTGKTTLARLIAAYSSAHFESLSAVLCGVKDIRAAVACAKERLEKTQKQTILFVDEVHRFNKAQQDAFLPYVEGGVITFIGATTENPSFEVNNALLSRVRVYLLKRLEDEAIMGIITHANQDRVCGLGHLNLKLSEAAMALLVRYADGDARRALNTLEIISDLVDEDATNTEVSLDIIEQVMSGDVRRFDKGGDLFYEQISALHKSVRGSDPDAALYWYCRMLDGGCDPLYIARRVLRMASEDVGNADPRGLSIALDAWQTYERLGTPEGELAIAQAIVYLAACPKSNAVYKAFGAAKGDAVDYGSLEVPMHLRNAPTKLMKSMDFGKGYRYAHDEQDAYAAGECYFPEAMPETRYYYPVERGLEIKIKQKLESLKKTGC